MPDSRVSSMLRSGPWMTRTLIKAPPVESRGLFSGSGSPSVPTCRRACTDGGWSVWVAGRIKRISAEQRTRMARDPKWDPQVGFAGRRLTRRKAGLQGHGNFCRRGVSDHFQTVSQDWLVCIC
jgi:hypothetical protein